MNDVTKTAGEYFGTGCKILTPRMRLISGLFIVLNHNTPLYGWPLRFIAPTFQNRFAGYEPEY